MKKDERLNILNECYDRKQSESGKFNFSAYELITALDELGYLATEEMQKDHLRICILQARLGRYTGKVICRWSSSGRGWRLHETNNSDAVDSVRQAIDNFIKE